MNGVRCMMMRGGTSRGLYFLADDLPADADERDDLLVRVMGSGDPRQVDGVGGGHSLTSKVAVVSAGTDADVDYLFLQVGVEEETVSTAQPCGNLLAGVAPFAIERGLVPAVGEQTTVRIRQVNNDACATAVVATPDGVVDYGAGIALELGTAATTRWPTVEIDGVEVALVDRGMPVVVARAADLGLTGHESFEALAADAALLDRVDRLRVAAARAMGLGDVTAAPIPKTVLVAEPAHDGDLAVRAFIPRKPHPAVGVLAAVSATSALLDPAAVGHELLDAWPRDRPLRVEHPSGVLLLDLEVDASTVVRAGVVRTARKLFDGTVYPR